MGALIWKSVYVPPAEQDGFRILVDRLWPRGLKKDRADLSIWAKQIAPSAALRKSYHQGILDYAVFASDYEKELTQNLEFAKFLEVVEQRLTDGNVTFVYASKQPQLSHIPILRSKIETELNTRNSATEE